MVITEFDGMLDSRFDFFVATDQLLAKTEGILNKCGWIPFIGTVTGGLIRATIAKVMFVVGIGMGIFKCFEGCFTNNSFCYKEAQQYAGYALHGFLNAGRAVVESIPFVNTILLIAYDRLVGRFSYSFENQRMEKIALESSALRI